MSDIVYNKFRAAAQVLQQGRDALVEAMAEDVLAQADELLDNNYLLNEFLESQGTRLHFLTMVLSQLEQSAEGFDEMVASQPPPVPAHKAAEPKKRKPRAKKMPQKTSVENASDD